MSFLFWFCPVTRQLRFQSILALFSCILLGHFVLFCFLTRIGGPCYPHSNPFHSMKLLQRLRLFVFFLKCGHCFEVCCRVDSIVSIAVVYDWLFGFSSKLLLVALAATNCGGNTKIGKSTACDGQQHPSLGKLEACCASMSRMKSGMCSECCPLVTPKRFSLQTKCKKRRQSPVWHCTRRENDLRWVTKAVVSALAVSKQ